MMAAQVQSGLATGSEGLVCFVCDVGVVGRYYALATCRTQTTKVRLIEKLGQLVGDDYMVVISEDDIICRGCATMINSLDRLEKELGSLRSMVLRYLERKYDLEDGELVNTTSNPAPVPSKSNKDVKPEGALLDFQSRKRKAMAAELDSDELRDTKDGTWFQCDKCKYTTNYNSFMVHHARSQHKDKNESQHDQIQSNLSSISQQSNIDETSKQNGGKSLVRLQSLDDGITESDDLSTENVLQPVDIKKDNTDNIGNNVRTGTNNTETVEMIAAEITGGTDFGSAADDSGTSGNVEGVVGVEPGTMLQMAVGNSTGDTKHMTLQAVEGEDGRNTLCMVDENGVIVQKVEQAEDGTLYVQVADNSDTTKQVLSVAEDGSVQMVEVLWDDLGTADETDGHGMVTF
ncbi:hypothetical protein O3M35_002547 [Rhynocoris fuscipes]|uniref:C2H2-type domain-containing protein n=1 Tax=Rhynocoris fuscipes TaxID=488301 RepID=A0AAW1CPT5_9HEMI